MMRWTSVLQMIPLRLKNQLRKRRKSRRSPRRRRISERETSAGEAPEPVKMVECGVCGSELKETDTECASCGSRFE